MKNKGKKLGFAGLLVVPAAVSIACAYTTSCAPKVLDDDSVVHLLDFNDFHGAAVGYGDPDYALNVSNKNPGVERIAKIVSDFQYAHPNTILLSGGDNNSGDCFSSTEHGATLFPLLKAMNVRHSAVGNHAFEWGIEYLTGKDERGEHHDTFEEWAQPDDQKREKKHWFLASNILKEPGYEEKTDWNLEEPTEEKPNVDYNLWRSKIVDWADPADMVVVGKHPIGLIGLTTQETQKDGNQKVVKNLSFIDYNASVNYAKFWLKNKIGKRAFDRIEAFVLLTHVESGQDESYKVSGAAADIARNVTTPVNAIISAHSHKEVCGWVRNRKFGTDVWVGQANTSGRALLDTKLEFDKPDSTGKCKLTNVSMSLIHPKIANSSLKAARNELISIRKQAMTKPKWHILRGTVEKFAEESEFVNEKFNQQVGKAQTRGEIYPACEDRQKLGHTYQWPSDFPEAGTQNFAVEQMGGWISYAQLEGFRLLTEDSGQELKPAISFISLDSITSEFKEAETPYPIKYGDIYQLQVYENNLYYGYLTIGQLANIAEYSLAGRNVFNYENNPDYSNLSSLNNDFMTGEEIPELEKITTCKYLCGPLQFWGMSFKTTRSRGRGDRERSIAYSQLSDKKIPKMFICDFAKDDKIKDPGTWTEVNADTPVNQLVPVLISSFLWTGGNKQNTMFKNYMEANEKQYGDTAKVQEFSWLTTDAIIRFLQEEQEGDDWDLGKDVVRDLVTW